MREDVIDLGVGAGERQDDAALQELGDAAGAYTESLGSDVRLLEVGVRGVEHQRDARVDLMVQHAAEPRVGALGHQRGVVHRGFGPLVVVDVEVLGPEDAPAEVLVLDLVLTEELGVRGTREERQG